MNGDRRAAPRHSVPPDVVADVSGVKVQLLELSLVGAKVEHQERFQLTGLRVNLTWRGNAASIAARAARSEIVGRTGSRLVYQTAVHFEDLNSISRGLVASILNDPDSELTVGRPPAAEPEPEAPTLDDTWIRKVNLLKQELDEDFPYAQFRLSAAGWQKEYVSSPDQPENGFTIARQRIDFDELQKAFEAADPETRRMMQIALETELAARPR
jgi:hypothetical protein